MVRRPKEQWRGKRGNEVRKEERRAKRHKVAWGKKKSAMAGRKIRSDKCCERRGEEEMAKRRCA